MVMTMARTSLVKPTDMRGIRYHIQKCLSCQQLVCLSALSALHTLFKAILILVTMHLMEACWPRLNHKIHRRQRRLTSSISITLCNKPFQLVLASTLTSRQVLSSSRALNIPCIENTMAHSSRTALLN